ncbi:MAG TPA: ferrous iron transporter B, partial [Ruminococcus sp.]|nr:ferrous iron transporter B [Ruminococcus sp.]
MTLKELKIGGSAVITEVGGEGALRQHFLDMGVIPGAEVKVLKYAPLGDPLELLIHGYSLSLRLADAAQIKVTELDKDVSAEAEGPHRKHREHPGLGE